MEFFMAGLGSYIVTQRATQKWLLYKTKYQIDGLVQERRNSSALAME